MFDSNSGDSYGKYKYYYIIYKFLNEKVNLLRVGGDFLETGNYVREFVCIYKPKVVIKIRENGFCYSCLFVKNVER